MNLAEKITKDQNRKIAEGITKLLEEVTNKPPSATYIVIEEVDRENWAVRICRKDLTISKLVRSSFFTTWIKLTILPQKMTV